MRNAVFATTLAMELLLGISFLLTFLIPGFRVWPPPSRGSWQFRFVWSLVDLCYVGFIAVGVLDWDSFNFVHWLRFPLGGLLMLLGLGLAVWGVRTLSLDTALGLKGDFITEGPYRFSRNPQYVGLIAAIAGYAIVANSWMTWAVGLLGALLFAAAPFLEEPWLEDRFGTSYLNYKRTVPRYWGIGRGNHLD